MHWSNGSVIYSVGHVYSSVWVKPQTHDKCWPTSVVRRCWTTLVGQHLFVVCLQLYVNLHTEQIYGAGMEV